METAKLNGLNPYAYLKWLFENVVLLSEGESMEHLTPWNCDSVEVNKIMH
ncbi:transposase domain-containing protein [Thiospirochaeta perfilievii]